MRHLTHEQKFEPGTVATPLSPALRGKGKRISSLRPGRWLSRKSTCHTSLRTMFGSWSPCKSQEWFVL